MAGRATASTGPITEGRKYRGAIVLPPIPGIHFNVTVLDFASLYPSVIKRWNLSYETICCPHPECRENRVPETGYWVCGKRRGIQSEVIGSLRDARVNWFKPKSSDPSLAEAQRRWYDAIQKALKVFLNASYGVFGFEEFPLYCPAVAESVAAIGRYAFKKAVKKAREMGLEVIYGDTDSLFIKGASERQVSELIEWAEDELGLDLEVDKRLRYAIFTKRKKAYIAASEDGAIIVKGLMAIKSNAFPLLTRMLGEAIEVLKTIRSPSDIESARDKIRDIIWRMAEKIIKREASVDELAISTTLSKNLWEYDRDVPHVKAAKLLKMAGVKISAGSVIRYVKAVNSYGVMPLHPAIKLDPSLIDYSSYFSALRAAANQILEGFGTSFEELMEERGGVDVMLYLLIFHYFMGR